MTKKRIFGTAVAFVAIALLLIVGSLLRLSTDSSIAEILLLSAMIVVLVVFVCLAYYARPSKWDRDK